MGCIHIDLPHTNRLVNGFEKHVIGVVLDGRQSRTIVASFSFAANLKTGRVIHSKGYLGLDECDSDQSRTEQHTGCILVGLIVWLMDPF